MIYPQCDTLNSTAPGMAIGSQPSIARRVPYGTARTAESPTRMPSTVNALQTARARPTTTLRHPKKRKVAIDCSATSRARTRRHDGTGQMSNTQIGECVGRKGMYGVHLVYIRCMSCAYRRYVRVRSSTRRHPCPACILTLVLMDD